MPQIWCSIKENLHVKNILEIYRKSYHSKLRCPKIRKLFEKRDGGSEKSSISKDWQLQCVYPLLSCTGSPLTGTRKATSPNWSCNWFTPICHLTEEHWLNNTHLDKEVRHCQWNHKRVGFGAKLPSAANHWITNPFAAMVRMERDQTRNQNQVYIFRVLRFW